MIRFYQRHRNVQAIGGLFEELRCLTEPTKKAVPRRL
jgi:hypothetical protein